MWHPGHCFSLESYFTMNSHLVFNIRSLIWEYKTMQEYSARYRMWNSVSPVQSRTSHGVTDGDISVEISTCCKLFSKMK